MLNIAFEYEPDGRWLAEISELPGVMAYGATVAEAQTKVEVLALLSSQTEWSMAKLCLLKPAVYSLPREFVAGRKSQQSPERVKSDRLAP